MFTTSMVLFTIFKICEFETILVNSTEMANRWPITSIVVIQLTFLLFHWCWNAAKKKYDGQKS